MSKQATPVFGKSKKETTIAELTEKLTRSTALYLIDPSGIKHKQMEEFRKGIKKLEAELTVVKNNLLKRALTSQKKSISEEALSGNSAVLFAFNDVVAPIKELTKFLKTINLGKIKSGLMQDTQLSISEIEKLATLPTREALLGKLVGQLQAPIYGLHNALSWNIRKLVWTLESIKTKKA